MADRATNRVIMLASAAALALAASAGWSAASAAEATPTASDTADSAAVGAVVITARKRSENLQRVPIAVTAQTGRQLEQQGIRQTTDLTRVVPSLTVSPSLAQNTGAAMHA